MYAPSTERLRVKKLVQLSNFRFQLPRKLGRVERQYLAAYLPAVIPSARGSLLQRVFRQTLVEVVQCVRRIDPVFSGDGNKGVCGTITRCPSTSDQSLLLNSI